MERKSAQANAHSEELKGTRRKALEKIDRKYYYILLLVCTTDYCSTIT